ncbi:MAG: hypothetical protein Q7V57_11260 [Actinomycetota bacterium]|nr:hypothetical protein [Actinomycetota bacterium]
MLTDQYGDPADADGSVTVTVDRANGTELVASTAAGHTSGEDGVYTVALTAAQTATLDELTATWHDVANNVDWVTHHRIVGGFLFTITQAREYDDVLADVTKYPTAEIAAKRDEVEDEAEWICNRAFVPSYARVTVSGAGTDRLTIGKHDIRVVRNIRVYSVLGGAYTDLTAGELASIARLGGGEIRRTDGGIFPWGTSNIVVDLEYGLDGPDQRLTGAAITHLRSRLNQTRSLLPDRTRSFSDQSGNTYELDGPDAYRTGIDAVDSVYARYSMRTRNAQAADGSGGAPVPASGSLSFDPQWGGLFRGGPR